MNILMKHVLELINEPYLTRGKEYFYNRTVRITQIRGNTVKARIAGSRVYQATLTLKNNKLLGTCNCPAFTDFGPCKHLAAVCYAVMDSQSRWGAPQ